MVCTSETIQGQIYIPAVNWVLMIVTIVIVAAFSNLANLTNAYGFAVATVMFSTSVLIATQIYYIKGLPAILAIGYFAVFGFFDALFWGASLKKVPHGAWVPLMIGILLLLTMWLWTWAKALEDKFDGANRQNLRHFIRHGGKASGALSEKYGIEEAGSSASDSDSTFYYTPGLDENRGTGEIAPADLRPLQRIPTCAIFHKIAEGKGVPHTFIGFYGVTYYIGFRDDFNVQISDLVDTICDLERASNPDGSAAIIEEIRTISQTATHIVPRYHVMSKRVNAGVVSVVVNWMRRYLIEDVYRRLATIFPETGNWLTSADEIIRVGITAVI
ncbi:hypothetical protein DXG01_007358 [Tephrocybe rancida]|nr:hypothetical protein DXG01_007358 [Tephrocybe rancida]